jgi:glycosyltransferase involved in cell wall biosynthesis
VIVGIASGDRISSVRATDGKNHWGGSGWVRLGQYESRLSAHGVDTYSGALVWNRDHFSIDITEDKHYYVDVDIVYIQRLMHQGLADHIYKARAAGQIVVNDLDDWYWGLDTSNHAFMLSHPKSNPTENINHYKSVLNASDVVTVSTQYLADRIKNFVRCPIEIIPNTVDVGRFTPLEHSDNTTPIVGWVGSTNHRSNDLEQLTGIIKPLYDSGDIRLQHSGYHEGSPLVSDAWRLPEDAVLRVPASDPEMYPSLLTMDVGIAPLRDAPFNHAKSDIKLLEYSAAGIPWIASNLSAYSKLASDWGIGRTAKKATQWIKHMKELKNPDTRSAEGSALREAVWQRDIGVGTKQLVEFLEHL